MDVPGEDRTGGVDRDVDGDVDRDVDGDVDRDVDGDETVGEALARVVARLDGGEARPGQQEMAGAVAAAIAARRHLLVQAGTGTGKSLAYLVPAILSGRRVVVVTATRALQDQLRGKDLPFLAEHLGRAFDFAQLKGRSNYLCRARRAELAAAAAGRLVDPGDPVDAADLAAIDRWAETSETGDRADLPFTVDDRLWSRLSIDARECPGRTRCDLADECFAEQARDRAAAADVVVVNAALYARHLLAGGGVLPEHDVVVVDEAHGFEDICAAAFGVELGVGRLDQLVAAVRSVLVGEEGSGGDPVAPLVRRADAIGRRLDACPTGAAVDLDLAGLRDGLAGLAEDLADLGRRLAAASPAGEEERRRHQRVARLVDGARGDVRVLLAARPDRDALWVEARGRPVLRLASVDVGPRLAAGLLARHTVVCTSATLAVGGDFAPLAWSLGFRPDLHPDREPGTAPGDPAPSDGPGAPAAYDGLDVGSPFDHRAQAVLYVAGHLPPPGRPGAEEAMLDEAVALAAAAGGRMLGLCTSLRVAEAMRDRLRAELDVQVFGPDDLPRSRLADAFLADETSCLVGSISLWQGLDLPGPAASLVVIDRLPFPRPGDPLGDARRARALAERRDPFTTCDLPRAAIMLAQGAGRLVRHAADRGVVAILDSRARTRGYAPTLLGSLPPMYRMSDPDRVRAALVRLRDAREGAAPATPG